MQRWFYRHPVIDALASVPVAIAGAYLILIRGHGHASLVRWIAAIATLYVVIFLCVKFSRSRPRVRRKLDGGT